MDRAKDMFCRILAVTCLRQHGQAVLQLNDKEMGTLQAFLKTPEYPFEVDDDYGTFGNNISIVGLVPHVKRTIILWDKTTLRNPMARQQVIEFIDSSTVRDRVWDVDQISLYCESNHAIHIEWNGLNHYAALVDQESGPVPIDAGFKAMLSTLSPVTRTKPNADLSSVAGNDGWCVIENGFRLDDDWIEIRSRSTTPPRRRSRS
eukprot:5062011-Prymnesium_polylepis.1